MTKNLEVCLEKLADDACWSSWYYWSRNAYSYFLVFRAPEDRSIAKGQIRHTGENSFACFVFGHNGWQYEEDTWTALSLEQARTDVQRRVNAVIVRERREEYRPYFG